MNLVAPAVGQQNALAQLLQQATGTASSAVNLTGANESPTAFTSTGNPQHPQIATMLAAPPAPANFTTTTTAAPTTYTVTAPGLAPQALSQVALKPTLQAAANLDPNARLLFNELARTVNAAIKANKAPVNTTSFTKPQDLLSSAFINGLDPSQQKVACENLTETVTTFIHNVKDSGANQAGEAALQHLMQETSLAGANQHLVDATNAALAELANINEPAYASNLAHHSTVAEQVNHRDAVAAKYASLADQVAAMPGRAAGAIKAFFDKAPWNRPLSADRLTTLVATGVQQDAAKTLAELRAGMKRFDSNYGSPEMKDIRSLEAIKRAVDESGVTMTDTHFQGFAKELSELIAKKTAQATN